ncbi:MAG: BamA/TamA family outer membrane protein [Armatimonadetes bacterium]|nr:BamA/TamA family outer membrane protein [Armatimonadota bacterium]MCX7966877.1 BamA/TamA family outer membrane protein [Armatimonadota bacterium]MDW8141835.1 POTRA domain-containing protein [Armatimonadota bacterium]
MVRWMVIVPVLLLLSPTLLAQEVEGREVAEIRVEGNKEVPSESILMVMDTKVGMPFSTAKLMKDIEAIYDMGFFSQKPVVLPMLTPEGRLILVVRVFENPVVKDIVFKGNTAIPSEKLKAVMQTQPGKILNFHALRRDLQRIQDLYIANGYIAQPQAPDILEDGSIVVPIQELKVISVKIDLGQKPKTKEKVVWRELELKQGQLYNQRVIEEDRRRLFLLDIFEEVIVEQRDIENPQTGELGVEVTYRLKEKKTGMANIGLGYSSRDEIVGFAAVQDTNFRGLGQHLRLMVEFFDRKGFDFYYYRPWIDNKRTGFAINIFDRSFYREPTTALVLGGGQGTITEDLLFSEIRRGVRLSARRPEGDYLWHELKLRTERVYFQQRRIVGGTVEQVGGKADQGWVTGIAYSRLLDTRDFPFDPSRGTYFEGELELSPKLFGGSRSFAKLLLDWRRYIPQGKNTVFASRLLLGTAIGSVPIFENFFVGGAETLRGYTIDRFVGRHMVVFNAELRRRFRKELQGVLFLDIGDAFGGPNSLDLKAAQAGEPKRRDTLRLKVGYGFGVRFVTPFGLLRFDFGFGEEGQRTHFSVGSSF